MKKFMKAIAFVTVMCMALSTVAFAETGAVLDETTEKVLDITVEGAANNEQVALMVVPGTAENNDFSSPLYIDQKAANGSGIATFEAVLTNAEVDTVDIYVGYSKWITDGHSTARKIGENVAITEPVEITVTKANVAIESGFMGDNGEIGAGVAATFTVNVPDNYEAEAVSMFWALEYRDGDTTKFKYTDLQDITAYGFGTAIENNAAVSLGITFLNGSPLHGTYDIEDVDAIFVFKNVDAPVVTDTAVLENKTAKNN